MPKEITKIVRKEATAAAMATKYGWPSTAKNPRSKEEISAAEKSQEKVIRIFCMDCADAALVCRDYIRDTYPGEYAEIIANKFQQLEEEDSSNESTATEDAENERLNNQTTGQQEQQKD